MEPQETDLVAVIRQVRTCFNQLKTLAEQLHHDMGVNPSMRAVREVLAGEGRRTVPDIAKNKGVSRQHIQTIMNSLQADGLVACLDNPAHKRSPLFDLTSNGRTMFAEIAKREKDPIRRLAGKLSSETLRHAQEALTELNHHLADEIKKGINDEKSN